MAFTIYKIDVVLFGSHIPVRIIDVDFLEVTILISVVCDWDYGGVLTNVLIT